jgi:formylglycine-generating enzyme
MLNKMSTGVNLVTVSEDLPPPQWELEWRVVDVAAQEFDLDRGLVSPDSRLINDLNIDSLELVELILALDETFGVTLPDNVVSQAFTQPFVTLGDVAAVVRAQWDTRNRVRDERQRWPSATDSSNVAADEIPFTQLSGRADNHEW